MNLIHLLSLYNTSSVEVDEMAERPGVLASKGLPLFWER